MSKAEAEADDDAGDAGGDSGSDKRTDMNDAGLHVLKGAIVSVLGARAAVTCGVRFSSATKATLTVEYTSGGKPTDAELTAIQDACNRVIASNLPLNEFKMEKKAAEAKYKAAPVNHTYVYDKFPVKADLTELNILEIPNWNVNACQGPHVKSTGALLGLYIQKQKYRKAPKNQHEYSFVVGKAAVDGLAEKAAADAKLASKVKVAGGAAPAAAAAAPAAKPDTKSATDTKSAPTADGSGGKSKKSDKKSSAPAAAAAAAGGAALPYGAPGTASTRCAVDETAADIVDSIVLRTLQAAIDEKQSLVSATGKVNGDALRPALLAKMKAALLHFQSAAYTAGYNSRIERQQNITDRL